MPTSNIKLRGPTSTTATMSIAHNFATSDGIILQLIGPDEKRLDVSWLSRYREEEERVFVHGCYPLQLKSVRLTSNCQNYGQFCKVLCQLDEACTADDMFDTSQMDGSQNMFKALQEQDDSVPKYIADSFKLWRSSKSNLIIDCTRIRMRYPQYLQQLMMTTIKKTIIESKGTDKYYHILETMVESNDSVNLIRPELILLFPNITQISIENCTSYQISITNLIRTMINLEQYIDKVKVVLTAYCNALWKVNKRSWLFYVWKDLMAPATIKVNDIEQTATVKAYFDKNDICTNDCVYSADLMVDGHKVELCIANVRETDGERKDQLYFVM